MIELKEAHQRVLNMLAIITEQKLMEIELSFIKQDFHQPINLTFSNDLSIEKKDKLHEVIQRLKTELKEFSQIYNVPKEQNSIQREVYTKTVFLWETLCEYTGHRLNHYGDVEEDVLSGIEKRVNYMIDLTLEMQKICKNES